MPWILRLLPDYGSQHAFSEDTSGSAVHCFVWCYPANLRFYPLASPRSPYSAQSSSEFHKHRPISGPSSFFVPGTNPGDWDQRVHYFVDLENLCITFLGIHQVFGNKYVLTTGIIKRPRNACDSTVSLPTNSAANSEKHFGRPTSSSTYIWLLTTWGTWESRVEPKFAESHKWTHKVKRSTIAEQETINRIHVGFAAVDECHSVKTPTLGPWRVLGSMKAERPSYRFWSVSASETLITADPMDVAAPLALAGSSSWDNSEHPYKKLTTGSLSRMKKAIDNNREKNTTEARKLASEAVQTFESLIPKVMIRRHNQSRWFGDRLVDLPKLWRKSAKASFPEEHRASLKTMVAGWQERVNEQLQRMQQSCDEQKHEPAYLRKYPERPTTLKARQVFTLVTCVQQFALPSIRNKYQSIQKSNNVSSSFYASEPNSQITINQVSNAISPSNPASGSSR